MKFSLKFIGLFVFFVQSVSFASSEIDMSKLEAQLTGEGLGGWVHGAVQDQSMFVFTWRKPNNFFVNVQLPMQSSNPEVQKVLAGLKRHDFVVLKGEFFENKAPLKHINITEVVSVRSWDGVTAKYNYDSKSLPEAILNSTEAVFKVHAVSNEGAVVVVEYGDRVFPVFNPLPKLAENLFRNDKIKMKYVVQVKEGRPAHLVLNPRLEAPLQVMERIEEGHGEPIELTGELVLFTKSPQIKFNVYALRTTDEDNVRRNYTLVNFKNIEVFFEIREILEKHWNENADSSEYDRNKFINNKILVTAKGTKNLVDQNQANPQIILESLKDIKVEVLAQ